MSLLLGGFIIFKEPKKFSNSIFALWLFSVFFWSFFQAWIGIADNEKAATLFQKIQNIGVMLIPILYLHFVFAFLGFNKTAKGRLFLKLNYAISFLFIFSIPTDYFIKGISTSGPLRFVVGPGLLFPYSVVWFIFTVGYALYKLLKTSLFAGGRLRYQTRYLFWATAIAYCGGLPNYLYVFNHPIPIINPFFNYGVTISIILLAYGIIKHKLLDIEIPFKNTLIYSLIYSFAIGIFSFLVIFFGQWAVYGKIDARVLWMCGLAVLIITFSVRPLDNLLTRLTDKILFHKQYDYKKTLRKASEGMVRIRSLDELLNLIVRLIVNSVHITHATIFLDDKENHHYTIKASYGRMKKALGSLELGENNPLIRWLGKEKGILVAEEVSEDIKEAAKNINAAICVPSFNENGSVGGFLALGDKLSGDMYTQEDIDVFATLANQATIAIENAQAYEELKNTKDQLAQSERLASVGRLAGGIAHEIKNPLSSIKTFVEFLPEEYKSQNFREKFYKIVGSEVDRINNIVEQLVDFSRPKPPKLENADIHQIINNVLTLLENDLTKNNVKVKKNYTKDKANIAVDKDQLKQVFLNLFINSIQAGADELKLITKHDKTNFVIEISDTGCGIPQKYLSSIFDPFFTTKEKGAGLGLSIVHSIIKSHSGAIAATSEPSTGTTFTIKLPLAK